MRLTDVPDLGSLLVRMEAITLETNGVEYHDVIRDWRKMKLTIEKLAFQPGEALLCLRQIYALPAFRSFDRVRRLRFRKTEAYREKRKKYDKANHAKRNTPEYREAKRKYDRERYAMMHVGTPNLTAAHDDTDTVLDAMFQQDRADQP